MQSGNSGRQFLKFNFVFYVWVFIFFIITLLGIGPRDLRLKISIINLIIATIGVIYSGIQFAISAWKLKRGNL